MTCLLITFFSARDGLSQKTVKLANTVWDAPFWDNHIDLDTIHLKKTGWLPQSLRFSGSGQLQVKRNIRKGDGGCGMGLLYLDNSSYSIHDDTLRMEIKGEYMGEESFHFKRDYLIRVINKDQLDLVMIREYFGKCCPQYMRGIEYADTPAPRHPSLQKTN